MNNDEPAKKIGTTMIAVAWVLVIVILTMVFSGYLDSQYYPNQQVNTQYTNTGQREVILQRGRDGHYVATGTINGHRVTFLLDTGATGIAIPEPVANRIGLKRGVPMTVSTANGDITVYDTKIDTVSLGLIEMKNMSASINPHDTDEEILLGMSFLKHLELIQKGDILILRL